MNISIYESSKQGNSKLDWLRIIIFNRQVGKNVEEISLRQIIEIILKGKKVY